MVFMVRGLFTRLRFPYAQFPCCSVTGELLFNPFWEAVIRLERMELKVCLSTVFILNVHFLAFERSVSEEPTNEVDEVAKSMMVFMAFYSTQVSLCSIPLLFSDW